VDAEAVTRATVLTVETRDTLGEAGDLQLAEGEAGGVLGRVTTLGALLDSGFARAEHEPAAITLFKSCGVAFEDLAVASLAFRLARDSVTSTRFRFAGPERKPTVLRID
jgi:ornithine cyclodeaminase/alanine dehydrogenase-like protein (mu-crystallin family)